MSDPVSGPEPAPAHVEPPPRRGVLGGVLLAVGGLVLAAALAAGGGWWWWGWWGPAPKGEIFRLSDGKTYTWFALPLDPGQAHVASATFQYAVAGFVLALVLGVVVGVLGRNRAYLGLTLTVLAACLGAYVMWQVGTALSPVDPSRYADAAHFGKTYPGAISVQGWTPYLAWPVGSLLGFLCVMLGLSGERRIGESPQHVREPSEPSDPVDPAPQTTA
ncbi:MAG: hypothetical protein FWE71_06310 [Nocardioidaceae bacterium]|nr:hypothetical protein [Nocardioidaceae bacterium]MCL2614662.1 hypothetical protein [Nocardioidaceae bacterium]